MATASTQLLMQGQIIHGDDIAVSALVHYNLPPVVKAESDAKFSFPL